MSDWISIKEILPEIDWRYEEVEVSVSVKFKTEYDIEFTGTLQILYHDDQESLLWCAKLDGVVRDVNEHLGDRIGKVTHWKPI